MLINAIIQMECVLEVTCANVFHFPGKKKIYELKVLLDGLEMIAVLQLLLFN